MGRAVTLLVTRPQPEADRLAARLRAAGYEALVAPMMRIERAGRAVPADIQDADGVVFTSVNGVRAFAEDLTAPSVPAYCVGARTAEAARAAGFETARSADGDAGDLIGLIRNLESAPRRLTLYRGAVAAVDLVEALPGIEFLDRVLYRTVAAERFPKSVETALRDGLVDGVLLLSADTARAFASLARAAGLDLSTLDAYCLSNRVASAIEGLGLRSVRVAARPDLDALLDLPPRPASTGS